MLIYKKVLKSKNVAKSVAARFDAVATKKCCIFLKERRVSKRVMDFFTIQRKTLKNGTIEVYPDFKYATASDFMVRGGAFYAIWDAEAGLWSTNEYDVARLVDAELAEHAKPLRDASVPVHVKFMRDLESLSWMNYKKFTKNSPDSYHQLDNKILFANSEVTRKDYASHRLSYAMENRPIPAYEELVSALYAPEERAKIEWAIGSVISGDAKNIQKFLVFYGEAGTGKSTMLNIIQMLFEGYYTTFEAKALTSSNNAFSTEVFRNNPLVAIQHDGDLSRIEDNTKLNSIVSHEEMVMNEKYKSSYTSRMNCLLFMGTNRPVKITDSKSGVIRRLIDVNPTGNKIAPGRYFELMEQIKFELGGIAYYCLQRFVKMGKNYYSSYRPLEMILQTDVFFNFVEENFDTFKEQDGCTLKQAYEMYKTYCDASLVEFKLAKYKFREELKNYFLAFHDWTRVDGQPVRNYYSGFITNKFVKDISTEKKQEIVKADPTLVIDQTTSILDDILADCPAQYAAPAGTPGKKWENVTTTLRDLDSSKLHYIRVPENHIVIDFDLKDSSGQKSQKLNLEAASKFPPTYAEFSKSGQGVHLHYIYDGDVSRLSRVYDDSIEVKVFTGASSLRRAFTYSNNHPITTINSGLPLKGDKAVVNFDSVANEKAIRTIIKKNLNKEYHGYTKPSIDFIYSTLEDAYASGIPYDVTDMRPAIMAFANNSTNNARYCLGVVGKMKFKSEEPSEAVDSPDDEPIIFYDIEVFPNLLVIVYKQEGEGHKCVRMINPSPQAVGELMKRKLVGFNCRRYDNHVIYARYIGYSNEECYRLSQRIINNSKNAMFSEAYSLSYTDVYDFASAGNKKSLKKLEIEMGIHHQELGLPWDQPVPEELWEKVAEYCENDVRATEAAFNYLESDWIARQILADMAGGNVNDSTNQLTTKFIFGANRKPQSAFNYRDLSQPVTRLDDETYRFLEEACPDMMSQRHGKAKSLLPYFPGYNFDHGKSVYRDEVVGEGGYVYSEPGIYYNVALLDISSMHPHSTIAECLFGVEFTTRFKEIVDARVDIKHEAWDIVDSMLGGVLSPYIQKVKDGEITSGDLANALKTAINSVYGLTSANFENAFHDPRNKDNIVAKRGALFMIDLKHAVQERGFTVAHIKTDSIKIPNATPEIIGFVMEFGKRYGYSFEHEATYERMCLVNKAVYIARYATVDMCNTLYGYAPKDNVKKGGKWSATGEQFAQPYVFKTLFTHEPITFEDTCETKNVNVGAMYVDMNENLGNDEHDRYFVGKTGLFMPVKPGAGGGELVVERNDKFDSVSGAKGYRWMEAEMVEKLGKQNDVDLDYYRNLVDEAIKDIGEYGDAEQFISADGLPILQLPWCDSTKDCTNCSAYKKSCEGLPF